ncbi:MAG: protein kinase [Lentisphaeria bacterium]|nr:protein kinase [Lentisphaeria bacterium]
MSEDPLSKLGSAPAGDIQEKTVRIDMDQLFSSDKTRTVRIDMDRASTVKNRNQLDSFGESAGSGDVPKLTLKPKEKYIFRKNIGRGGMKMVIQVKDRDTMRDIAMALFPDSANRPDKETKRFIEEARITASLEHPNIVPVHDIGIDSNGSPYFTMKLLRGETLASILKKLNAGDPEYKELYTLDALLRIFIKVCDAVAFAHSKGVIHLDLKPENIQIGDFGEVLLMDFGLAKVISKADKDEEAEAPSYSNQNFIPGVTIDGVTKGTPGYMAPEQAAGKNSLKDFRTDVYSLGAILYSIATYQNPISERSTTMKEMMTDTVKGRIIPPRERAPERMIPYALEAVIRKAMTVQLPGRYQSVKELRDEVYSFRNGFATQAEKAGVLKRFFLLIRRNKITFPAITLSIFLLLGISFYALDEASKYKPDWIPVYSEDFTGRSELQGNYAFYNSTVYSTVDEWRRNRNGMFMKSQEWFFLKDLPLGSGTKAVLKFVPKYGSVLRIALNTPIQSTAFSWENPTGYVFSLSAVQGGHDIIWKNGTSFVSGDSTIIPEKLNTVEIERSDNHFRVSINGEEAFDTIDMFPLTTAKIGSFGIRSDGEGTILHSLELYRQAPAEKASPLIAGDVLLERKHYADAVEQYLIIAESYKQGPITDMAIMKAYAAAAYLRDPGKRETVRNDIKERLVPKIQSPKFSVQILEIDALSYWNEQRYTLAFETLDQVFQLDPKSEIMLKILQLPNKKLPPNVLDAMLEYIAKNKNINRLELSGYGITSLAKLQGMRLNYLNCSGNRLTSLDGLERMPLEVLNCSDNMILSLDALRYIALKDLNCKRNRITSLEPLNMVRLRTLDVSYNKIASLKPLAGQNLDFLAIRGNLIHSLDSLYGMKLRFLDAGENSFISLMPLKDMPLEILLVDGSGISSLAPIQSMKLKNLGLFQCKRVKDLTPIFNMESLQYLSLPPDPGNIEPLRKLPQLLFISKRYAVPRSEKSETASEFWKQYAQK